VLGVQKRGLVVAEHLNVIVATLKEFKLILPCVYRAGFGVSFWATMHLLSFKIKNCPFETDYPLRALKLAAYIAN
jgi:hypothetical protein